MGLFGNKKKEKLTIRSKEDIDNLPKEVKKEILEGFKRMLGEDFQDENLQNDLENDGIIIEMDSIPVFIDFICNNMKIAAKVTGQDEKGDGLKGLHKFLKHQEKLFKEHMKNRGN